MKKKPTTTVTQQFCVWQCLLLAQQNRATQIRTIYTHQQTATATANKQKKKFERHVQNKQTIDRTRMNAAKW